jgi:predicted DsbA family dithiol-disulfide isomerase
MNIEIWSDIACPFCYINKRRFDTALAAFEHRADVTVTWRSFELDPQAPVERTENDADRLAAKYGWSREQALAKLNELAQSAAADGLEFNYDIQRSGSSFDGHRIIHYAAEYGLASAMKERLMIAFWNEGALIGDHDALVLLAAEVGIPPAETRAVLESDRFTAKVREDEEAARRIGVKAVPSFAVDGKLSIAGSQSVAQLTEFLQRRWAGRAPAERAGNAV